MVIAIHLSVLLEVNNLSKHYPKKAGLLSALGRSRPEWHKAVDNVSFSVDRGKVLVIAGESGSGKTTIAKMVTGATAPTSGTVTFDGVDVWKLRGHELKQFRSKVHMVYQDPYSSLDPRMKVMDIVMEPLNIHEGRKSTRGQKEEKVLNSLVEVRLAPEIAQLLPQDLSGGQRQRVAIARAIVLRPQLIVADEPVSMLDVSVRAEILNLMMNLKDQLQSAFIYITHDLSTARYVGDSIIVMKNGTVREKGSIDQVLLQPSDSYTKALISAIPDISSAYQDVGN